MSLCLELMKWISSRRVTLKGRSEDDVKLKEHGLSQGSGKPFHQLSSLLHLRLSKDDTKILMIIDINNSHHLTV